MELIKKGIRFLKMLLPNNSNSRSYCWINKHQHRSSNSRWWKCTWKTNNNKREWLSYSFKTVTFNWSYLRANVSNFRESVDSREFLNFFIFCPHNLYSTLISKITLKLVTAFYFFLNWAKFEKRQIGTLSSMKLAKIKHFLCART